MIAELDLQYAPMSAPPRTDKTVYHVGISGGKDSTAALLWLLHESDVPREQIQVTFCDIGNDHPATLEHVALISKRLHPVVTIRPALPFFDLAFKKRRFPSAKARFCTQHLKIDPTAEHLLLMRYEGFEPVAVTGVRADESEDRSKLSEWDYSGTMLCHQWRPLIRWTLEDVLAIHAKYKFPLNPLYALGAERVGCWPCCMSKKAEIRIIADKCPERIDEIREWEQRFEKVHGRYSSFFPAAMVPERFRSKPYQAADGTWIMVATIDDVVRWSRTGKGAREEVPEPDYPAMSCKSGFCE